MPINIGTKYRLISEPMNIVLQKRNKSDSDKIKSGKSEDVWKTLVYFGNLRYALNYLIEHEAIESGMKDVKTVVSAIKEAEASICTALAGIPVEAVRQSLSLGDSSGLVNKKEEAVGARNSEGKGRPVSIHTASVQPGSRKGTQVPNAKNNRRRGI